jgi:acetyl-CoA synthetase
MFLASPCFTRSISIGLLYNVGYRSLEDGSVAWFENGLLNVSYNCIDRHLDQKGDQPAIIWETDDPNQAKSISFRELYRHVNQFANALKECGVQRGDRVAIYMHVRQLSFTNSDRSFSDS